MPEGDTLTTQLHDEAESLTDIAGNIDAAAYPNAALVGNELADIAFQIDDAVDKKKTQRINYEQYKEILVELLRELTLSLTQKIFLLYNVGGRLLARDFERPNEDIIAEWPAIAMEELDIASESEFKGCL